MTDFRSEMEKKVWGKVKDLPEFHWTDLTKLGCAESTAMEFIRRWKAGGRVRQLPKIDGKRFYVNADLPAPRADLPPAVRSAEDAMWTLMRRLKVFTPTDIAAHVNAAGFEVTVDKARSYCRRLLGAEYLRVRQTAIPGQREPAYQLINDTGLRGPRPARISGLVDPNTKMFTPAGDLS